MVILLAEIGTVLPELGNFFCLLRIQLSDFSFFFLKCPEEFLIFPDKYFLGFLNHFQFLIKASGHLLSPFDLLVSSFVFDISDFLLKVELITDDDIVQFFVLHAQILRKIDFTLHFISNDLLFSSRFLILRSNSKVS